MAEKKGAQRGKMPDPCGTAGRGRAWTHLRLAGPRACLMNAPSLWYHRQHLLLLYPVGSRSNELPFFVGLIFFKVILFLFLAALGLCCGMGFSLVVALGLLAVASLVAEQGL